MAKSEENAGKPGPPSSAWSKLTWEHLTDWAGARTVDRGRSYQRGGRVKDLKTTEEGELLASVMGTLRYATTVSIQPGRVRPTLHSDCTCPVGDSCKHAVAVVADFLDDIAKGTKVPLAAEDDPRWAKLEEDSDGSDDEWDEDEDDDFPVIPARAKRRAAPKSAPSPDWKARIEQHIRSKSREDLADLAWTLTLRFPEVFDEFREMLALREGDVDRLVAEARDEIRRSTSDRGRGNRWDEPVHTPNYDRVKGRLERLLEQGHADEVVTLGRELLEAGFRQIGESDDEGETINAFGECLPTVFQAVANSSLSPHDRLLFAVDAELADEHDVTAEAIDAFLEAPVGSDAWSAVADTLAARLESKPIQGDRGRADFSTRYRRDRLSDWIATALDHAGREGELGPLFEAEARETGSYERLVDHLIGSGRLDEAEHWAIEGIGETIETYAGTANSLASKLREVAAGRKQWDVVAAHAAWTFFDRPGVASFDELIKTARKANVEAPVHAWALRFLETGTGPITVLPPPRPTPPPRSRALAKKADKSARPEWRSRPVDRLEIAPDWPLPVPEALIPFLLRARIDPTPRPHLGVLIEMAIVAKRPAEALRWYDQMRRSPGQPGRFDPASAYTDKVASAVVASHPDRAIEIYRAALDAVLPLAHASAYESAARYLRLLRPIHEAQGRAADWAALVASIRESYRNRPRFLEVLDRLEGRPIVETARARRK